MKTLFNLFCFCLAGLALFFCLTLDVDSTVGLASVPAVVAAASRVSDERTAEIRKMKSAKTCREKVGELAKEIQKHRDKINADDYEWRQEDENKLYELAGERRLLIERAEFLEAVERVTGDVAKDLRNDPIGGDGRDGRTSRTAGPMTVVERIDAINHALARFLGVKVSRENMQTVKRAAEQGVFSRQKNELVFDSPTTAQDFRSLQTIARSGRDVRDLTVNDGSSSAGLLGQRGFIAMIERAMLYFGPMMQEATILPTNNGRDVDMPTVDDTANEASVVGEAADVSGTQDPTLGEQTWQTVKLNSKRVKYSAEAGEDSVFDLFELLVSLLGERLGRGANRVWTLGSTTKVQGAASGAAAGVTITAASIATDDEALATKLIALKSSVDPAYRVGNAAFMFNSAHEVRLQTLKDSNGQWMYKFSDGNTGRLNGSRIVYNNHMAATLAATDRPFVYGDLSKYWARVVRQIRMRRFVELHGDNDQDAVQLFRRVGGRWLAAGAKAMVLT